MSSYPALADDSKPGGNVLTYADLKVATVMIATFLTAQKDVKARVGVMLPASAGATIVTFAVLLAGKVPVMLNFTTGAEQMRFCLKDSKCTRSLTSRRFMQTLLSKGVQLPPDMGDTLLFIEDVLDAFTTLDKLSAWFLAKTSSTKTILQRFHNTHTYHDVAAILFTSGSTANPKGVPLTNRNVIECLRGVVDRGELTPQDIIMAALPPFHSFGFTATVCCPVVYGVRCVYYPNPTAFYDIGRQMCRWKPTVYISTPSWMLKVYGACKVEWTSSLRCVLVGAEACPSLLKDLAKQRGAQIMEGYGITETSPAIATTCLGRPSVGCGWPIEGVEVQLVTLMDPHRASALASQNALVFEQFKERERIQAMRVHTPEEAALQKCRLARPIVVGTVEPTGGSPSLGTILVSGATVFGNSQGEAYLNHPVWEQSQSAASAGEYKFDPYVEFAGKVWYNTEDLGSWDYTAKDKQGRPALVIGGRVKRFVKRGGEMISLGAIEDALLPAFPDVDQKRASAVECAQVRLPDGTTEPRIAALILSNSVGSKSEAEQRVRAALQAVFQGSSLNLHMPDRVLLVPAIPILGTGKLDLQGCKAIVEAAYR